MFFEGDGPIIRGDLLINTQSVIGGHISLLRIFSEDVSFVIAGKHRIFNIFMDPPGTAT